MIRILHIIPKLSLGGASRSLFAIAKHLKSFDNYQHMVVSLSPRGDEQLTERNGLSVLEMPSQDVLRQHIERADIVHVEWWNNPRTYDFLRTSWPPMRLLAYCHVGGDASPHLITSQVVDFVDFWVSCCGYAHRNPVIQQLPPEVQYEKTAVVIGTTDFDRLENIRKKAHTTFNVVGVGRVDFKMHSKYVAMSSQVRVPNVRFILCGRGHLDLLRRQAEELDAADRFEFRGYVEDIRSVFEVADVYAYPLNPRLRVGSELNLQEAMFAGIPPVIFPYGGVADFVRHRENGMVVYTEKEYAEAIEYLYEHPHERLRMGQAARHFALQYFGGKNCAAKLHQVYQALLRHPKREHVWHNSTNMSMALSGNLGARYFVESLGSSENPYHTSLYGQDVESVLSADEQIADQNLMEQRFTELYYDFYPQDGYFPYWLGLGLQYLGEYERALEVFSQAQLNGPTAWRLPWQQARLAATLGDREEALEFCRLVLAQNPDFIPALRLVDLLS